MTERGAQRRATAGDSSVDLGPVPQHEGTELLWLISHAYRLSRARTERAVRAHGVTAAQFILLRAIADEPRLTGLDLAERAMITPQAAHAALTALANKGLIERAAETAHRRVVRTSLTEQGRAVLRACLDDLLELGVEYGSRLDDQRRRALLELLREYVLATAASDDDSRY